MVTFAHKEPARSRVGNGRVNHCLRLVFTIRKPCGSVATVQFRSAVVVSLEPSAIAALQSLLIGFAFAGLLASAFELFNARRADF